MPVSKQVSAAPNPKIQPWKAFLTVNTDKKNAGFKEVQNNNSFIRLRIEADDKGGLGG